MSHYRIVETGEGFTVQQRFLWFFWTDCAEPYFITYDGCDLVKRDSQYWVYETLESAKNAIKRMEHMFYEYKGHDIIYYMDYNFEKHFVDLNSSYKDYKGNKKYRIYGDTLDIVREKIDKMNWDKEIEIDKKKTKNIYYV